MNENESLELEEIELSRPLEGLEYVQALLKMSHPRHVEAMLLREEHMLEQNKVYLQEGEGKEQGELITYRVS